VLIEQHPDRGSAVRQQLVRCPPRWRRDVERLLGTMDDLVIVVSADEQEPSVTGRVNRSTASAGGSPEQAG
jgi:hypothetical protein